MPLSATLPTISRLPLISPLPLPHHTLPPFCSQPPPHQHHWRHLPLRSYNPLPLPTMSLCTPARSGRLITLPRRFLDASPPSLALSAFLATFSPFTTPLDELLQPSNSFEPHPLAPNVCRSRGQGQGCSYRSITSRNGKRERQ